MNLEKQGGYVSGTLVSLIVAVVLLFGAIGFGAWAFAGRQDYKNNSDKKAAQAADERQAATEAAEAVKYAEAAKSPLKTHKSPDQFGGVTVQYPKTWSGYTEVSESGSTPVDNYFHPDVVPSVSAKNDVSYALRVQVIEQTYDRVVESFESSVQTKKVVASPIALAKVPGVVGTRFVGQIDKEKQGVLIILPIRNLTLKVWTESSDFVPDFENLILPNLVFAP